MSGLSLVVVLNVVPVTVLSVVLSDMLTDVELIVVVDDVVSNGVVVDPVTLVEAVVVTTVVV